MINFMEYFSKMRYLSTSLYMKLKKMRVRFQNFIMTVAFETIAHIWVTNETNFLGKLHSIVNLLRKT